MPSADLLHDLEIDRRRNLKMLLKKGEPVVGPRAHVAAYDAVIWDRLAVSHGGQRCGQEGRANDLGHVDCSLLPRPAHSV